MPSFISNFRGIAATAAICVTLYCVLVELAGITPLIYPDQNISNLARAEQVMIGGDQKSAIIVGSSLAARLPKGLWPDGMMNLGFAGKNAIDGLDLLSAHNVQPNIILVETNWITRPPNLAFVEQITSSLLYPLRPYVRGLQVDNQPVNLLLTVAFRLSGRSPDSSACGTASFQEQSSSAPAQAFLTPPEFSEDDIARSITRLAKQVDAFQKAGIRVILVEFPMSQAFASAPGPTRLRQALSETFADVDFWTFDHSAFQTTDGQHLTFQSSIKFGCLLVERVRSE